MVNRTLFLPSGSPSPETKPAPSPTPSQEKPTLGKLVCVCMSHRTILTLPMMAIMWMWYCEYSRFFAVATYPPIHGTKSACAREAQMHR